MKIYIGLMGVGNDNKTLYSPNGKRLFKVPFGASLIQKIQHKIACITHNFKRKQ